MKNYEKNKFAKNNKNVFIDVIKKHGLISFMDNEENLY